jgi:hypothetical protein
MKKFSKIVENIENEKNYKISAHIELLIPASNSGEASYLADSILSSVKYNNDYIIDKIEESDEKK